MGTSQLLGRPPLPRIGDPGRCLAEVNRQLCTQVYAGQFVTMQVAILDPATARVFLATAGHPEPLLMDGKGFKRMKLEPQFVLGVECDATYETEEFDLPDCATLLLYTDGASDVQSPDGRRLGDEGLRRLTIPRKADASALIESVV